MKMVFLKKKNREGQLDDLHYKSSSRHNGKYVYFFHVTIDINILTL